MKSLNNVYLIEVLEENRCKVANMAKSGSKPISKALASPKPLYRREASRSRVGSTRYRVPHVVRKWRRPLRS